MGRKRVRRISHTLELRELGGFSSARKRGEQSERWARFFIDFQNIFKSANDHREDR